MPVSSGYEPVFTNQVKHSKDSAEGSVHWVGFSTENDTEAIHGDLEKENIMQERNKSTMASVSTNGNSFLAEIETQPIFRSLFIQQGSSKTQKVLLNGDTLDMNDDTSSTKLAQQAGANNSKTKSIVLEEDAVAAQPADKYSETRELSQGQASYRAECKSDSFSHDAVADGSDPFYSTEVGNDLPSASEDNSNCLAATRVAVLDLLQGLRQAASAGGAGLPSSLVSSFLSHWHSVSSAKTLEDLEPYLAAFSGSAVGDPSAPFTPKRCVLILKEMDRLCSNSIVSSQNKESFSDSDRPAFLENSSAFFEPSTGGNRKSLSSGNELGSNKSMESLEAPNLQPQQVLYCQLLRSIWQRWRGTSQGTNMKSDDTWLDYHQRKILDATTADDLFIYRELVARKVVADTFLCTPALLVEVTNDPSIMRDVQPLSLINSAGDATIEAIGSALNHLCMACYDGSVLQSSNRCQGASCRPEITRECVSRSDFFSNSGSSHSSWSLRSQAKGFSLNPSSLSPPAATVPTTEIATRSEGVISSFLSKSQNLLAASDARCDSCAHSPDNAFSYTKNDDGFLKDLANVKGVAGILRALALPAVFSNDISNVNRVPTVGGNISGSDIWGQDIHQRLPVEFIEAALVEAAQGRNRVDAYRNSSNNTSGRTSDEQKYRSELQKLLATLTRGSQTSASIGDCASVPSNEQNNFSCSGWSTGANGTNNKMDMPSAGYPNVSFDATHNRWIAFWRINGKNHSKSFNCLKYGGREEARLHAVEFRKQIELQFFWNMRGNGEGGSKPVGGTAPSSSPGESCLPSPSLNSMSSCDRDPPNGSITDVQSLKCLPTGYMNDAMFAVAGEHGLTSGGIDDKGLSSVHKLLTNSDWKSKAKKAAHAQTNYTTNDQFAATPPTGVMVPRNKGRAGSKKGRQKRPASVKKGICLYEGDGNAPSNTNSRQRVPRTTMGSRGRGRSYGFAGDGTDANGHSSATASGIQCVKGISGRDGNEWGQQRLRVVSGSITFDRSQNRFMAQWKTSDGCKHSKSFYTKNFSSLEEAQLHALRFKEGLLAERDQERSLAAANAMVRGSKVRTANASNSGEPLSVGDSVKQQSADPAAANEGRSTNQNEQTVGKISSLKIDRNIERNNASIAPPALDIDNLDKSAHQALECILSRSVQSCLQEAGERGDQDLSPTSQLVGNVNAVVDAAASACKSEDNDLGCGAACGNNNLFNSQLDCSQDTSNPSNTQKNENSWERETSFESPTKKKKVDSLPKFQLIEKNCSITNSSMPTLLQRAQNKQFTDICSPDQTSPGLVPGGLKAPIDIWKPEISTREITLIKECQPSIREGKDIK